MKKYLIVLAFITCTGNFISQCQPIKVSNDERVELLSIVAQMANISGYSGTGIISYGDDINEYFKPYMNDSLILFAKKIRKQKEIAYDAITRMAVHIQIKDGKISWKENIKPNSMNDDRWDNVSEKFVRLLSSFYVTSNFHDFFIKHKSLYESMISKYDSLYNKFNTSWFSKFTGNASPVKFHYVIAYAFLDGGYGPHVTYNNDSVDTYSIVGIPIDRRTKKIKLTSWDYEATVHEFCHTFCNPIVENYSVALIKANSPYYKKVSKTLLPSPYRVPLTVLRELLTRAATIMYLSENGMNEEEISKRIISDQALGFITMPALITALKQYQKSRDKYPALNDFIPVIIDVLKTNDPKKLYEETMSKFPEILSFSIANKSKNIDPDLTELKITFNMPMTEYENGFLTRSGLFIKTDVFPEILSYSWDKETHRELTIHFKLKPDKFYKMFFDNSMYRSDAGLMLAKEYTLKFKTGESKK